MRCTFGCRTAAHMRPMRSKLLPTGQTANGADSDIMPVDLKLAQAGCGLHHFWHLEIVHAAVFIDVIHGWTEFDNCSYHISIFDVLL